MKKPETIFVIAVVTVSPLLLWVDVWLSFLFGFWVDALVGGTDGMAGMLGFFAFFVLAGAEAIVGWLTYWMVKKP